VKGNRPSGRFPPSAPWTPPDLARAGTVEKEHGRIETTASLADLLSPDWAGAAQVCRITRERVIRGRKTVETVHAFTSLTREQAGPDVLLALSRAH
jgi:hypothetical protein